MSPFGTWDCPLPTNETLSLVSDLALSHARKGGSQGLAIALLIEKGCFKALCDFELDYQLVSIHEAIQCRQALAFFTKYEDLPLKVDKKQVAIEKFKEAERACRETNEIFKMRAQGGFNFSPWVESVLLTARRKIARVLGDLPRFCDVPVRFGPGATTSTKKRLASTVEKLQAPIACTQSLLPYVSRLLEEVPGWCFLHTVREDEEFATVEITVSQDVVEFVPKNAKTFRSISKGPSLNTMFQNGFGDIMAKRMRAFGIDITDQVKNQRLAREGSLYDSLATIDLSSASDTISTELVYELLPIDWAASLDVLRSREALIEGSVILQEKFCSMGNGFTFPLETLIFWALTSSASDDNWASVYGDDIIVGSSSVRAVYEILSVCGFTINKSKSFTSGPFRESCGADYLRGFDVRPWYLRAGISVRTLFGLHNFYVRTLQDDEAAAVKQLIPRHYWITGPDGFGDGHLLGDWIPRRHKKSLSHGYGGFIFDTFVMTGRRDKRHSRPGDRVLPFYTIYRREPDENVLCTVTDPLVMSRFAVSTSPLALPEGLSRSGDAIKHPSFPGTFGYRKISIYTLSPS